MRTRDNLWAALDDSYDPYEMRRMKSRKQSRRKPNQIRGELAEELEQPEADFNFTYKAGRHEQQWLASALGSFYADSLISDVLSIVRGGKEANVYCCRANPAVGYPYLAVKVYRPRLLRNLKNDAIYKEGRAMLADNGKTLRDQRSLRAIHKKTRIGSELIITSWIEYEFQTLQLLYKAGADVPGPVAQAGNAILMEFIGEPGSPAPALSSIALGQDEAHPLFERLMHNVALMLEHDRIHGDLSPYNVLYWDGQVNGPKATLIDFPQVVDPLGNPRADALLHRDIERLCQYFNRYGLELNADRLATELWGDYLRRNK